MSLPRSIRSKPRPTGHVRSQRHLTVVDNPARPGTSEIWPEVVVVDLGGAEGALGRYGGRRGADLQPRPHRHPRRGAPSPSPLTCWTAGSPPRVAKRLRMLRSDICSRAATGGMRDSMEGRRVTSAFMSLSSSSSWFSTASRARWHSGRSTPGDRQAPGADGSERCGPLPLPATAAACRLPVPSPAERAGEEQAAPG